MAKRHTGSIICHPSGTRVWPLELNGKRIDIVDVASSLGNLCRYNGHVSEFYSVGEHCVRLYDYGPPELKPHLLLHDVSEYLTGDLVAPLKYLPEFAEYRRVEAVIMGVVYEKFGLDPVEPEEVKYLDLAIRVNEMRDLKGIEPKKYGPPPLDIPTIKPWLPKKAKTEFLKRAKELGLHKGRVS
jgi:hypothetical protein